VIDIKQIRKLSKLKQIEFAEIFGITQGYLSDLENKKQSPGDELLTSIINYAHENSIDISETSFQEPSIHYDRQKKNESSELDFYNQSDKTIKVSDYNATDKYKEGDLLTLHKVERIVLGREYVFWIKSDPVAYIGRFLKGSPGSYIIQVPRISEQEIPIDEIDSVYVITGIIISKL
jgi:transcriptional regulator with XRE-family HTH domain